jgi:pyruvate ferredoxin oxidoreductase delta subunit
MYGPIVSKPGASRSNKTGAWRAGKKPKFLKTNCIACKMCLLICPEGCISGKEKNTFDCDLAYCKGCGNCAAICPKQDIEMVEE